MHTSPVVKGNTVWPRNQRRQLCIFEIFNWATGSMELKVRRKYQDLKAISVLLAHGPR